MTRGKAWVSALACGWLIIACGSSKSEPEGTTEGTGGVAGSLASGGSAASGSPSTAGSMAMSGGTGGSGAGGVGGTTSGRSQLEACFAYVQGVCELTTRCGGSAPSQLERCVFATRAQCPDVTFSPGSTRTVEGLFACGAVYSAWSCERYMAGERPDCVTPGTRALGESCSFASQCASHKCSAAGGCGECEAEALPNGDCAPNIHCPAGQICENSRCVPDEQLNQYQQLGQACGASLGCSSEWWCNSLTAKCETKPTLDESCEAAGVCVDAYVCDSALGRCVARPSVGQSCGSTWRQCAPGAYCGDDDRCHPSPVEGEPCAGTIGFCAEGFACHADLRCHARGSTPNCEADRQCEDGSRCVNTVCLPEVALYAPCDATNTCPNASTCEAGTCQPQDLQGLFARCEP